jgi:hypothetical protein
MQNALYRAQIHQTSVVSVPLRIHPLGRRQANELPPAPASASDAGLRLPLVDVGRVGN